MRNMQARELADGVEAPRKRGGRGQTFLSPLNKEAGKFLAAHRKRRGWNQERMAKFMSEALGWRVTVRSIQAWEAGARSVPAAAFVAVDANLAPSDEGDAELASLPPEPAPSPEYLGRFLRAYLEAGRDPR